MSLLTRLAGLAGSIVSAALPAALLAALLAAPGSAAAPAQDAPEVIRLKVGTEVVGVIEPDGFDEARGVRVRRVDDGALLDIGFDQMLPEDARRIRGLRGYLSDEPEPVLVEAMKVRLLTGDEFLGVIVEQGTETFKLRREGKEWEFKRATVREITPVRVDALEVYDPEELYAEELSRRNPVTALDFYNLALYCESLQLWAHVKEHLAQVQTLDPAFKADIVSGKIRRSELRLESSEDSALLAKAQRLAQREQYDQSLGLIDDFLTRKPGSAMKVEFDKTRRLIARQRDKWIKNQVIFNFFIFIERAARSIANDSKGSCKEARKRMELEGTNMALEATANALKVKVEEVRALWEDEKRQTASPHYASYESGTWTLGDMDAVLKGLVKEDPSKAAGKDGAGATASGDESLEDRIKKVLEQKAKEQADAQKRAKEGGNKKAQQKAAEIADIPPTDDEWWEATGAEDRTEYLLAWWADHDPHVKIIRVDGRACPACAGLGILKYFDRNGDDKFVPCPRCKGCQIDRILRYH